MEYIRTIQDWRAIRSKLSAKKIGFVPTMGYLHEGHLSLVTRAREEADIVVLSIFVNPLQFGVNEDFSTYPRDLERDGKMAEEAGVDFLFCPDVSEMYPTPPLTQVNVKQVTDVLCGASRPGHFEGVATVVTKLFNIIQPEYAYFGLKDAQQVAVIQQMVHDLNIPVLIKPCPILREQDGLAMSSRNVYLTTEERQEATVLYRTLQWAKKEIEAGERQVEKLIQGMKQRIEQSPHAQIDYVEIRKYPSLEPLENLNGKILIALAVKLGKTRLIDNLMVEI